MQPIQSERSLDLNHLHKYNRIYKKINYFPAKVYFSETKFCKQNIIKKIGQVSFKSQYKYRRSNSSTTEISTKHGY